MVFLLRQNVRMRIAVLFVFSFWVVTCAADSKLHHIIEHINNANVSWQAGLNTFHASDYKKLVGTFQHLGSSGPVLDPSRNDVFGDGINNRDDCNTARDDDETNVQETFDARYHWFNCTSISHIWNQGNCAADWAISVTSVMNDRICIASQGKITALYSPQKLVSCCENCGNGCKGGYTAAAWEYIQKRGIVTGGDYGSHEGCQPWLIPPCNSSTKNRSSSSSLGPRGLCGDTQPTTPKCDLSCYNSKHNGTYLNDIIKAVARKTYVFSGCSARKTLRKHGPYVATMRVYEDFLTYKSGVYQHVTGEYLGMLSVRMIGWGMDHGIAYWLLANSWGTEWGEKGFFKIRRFVNECWIENFRYAGDPDLSRHFNK